MDLFKKPDPKEIQRKQQREFKSINRDLDRDKRELERQESALQAEIKKAAKQGNTNLAKTLAKQLIKLRAAKDKNLKAQSTVTSMGFQTKVSV